MSKVDLDSWATKESEEKRTEKTACKSCRSPFRDTIQSLLKAMIRAKAHNIGRKAVYAKLKKMHPDYPNRYKSFENHLYSHEAELWAQAMGRDLNE
jgi:hypothetical protein